jgi:hypothetical protein
VRYFPLEWKGCTFNVTTLSHSSIKGEQRTCFWTCHRVPQYFSNFIFWDRKSGRNLQMFWRKQLAVSTIKMEEPTTSNFIVEKRMINSYRSAWCHNQDDSSLCRHCYENLKYHSKAKNATNISSSVHKIASCPKIFRFLK